MFKSINEVDKFGYDDCIVNDFSIIDNDIVLKLDALIVKKNNSQNSNYTDSYAGDAVFTLSDAKVVKLIKEGYKRFDANDVLVEEVADEVIDLAKVNLEEKFSRVFLINADKNDVSGEFILEMEIPDTEPAAITDIYELTICAQNVVVEWNKYMNKVQ